VQTSAAPRRSSTAPQFTVAIPVFNEAEILRNNVLRLSSYLESIGSYEILIGVNGSTDASVEICRQLAADNPRIRYFSIPERRLGHVFQRFLLEARSDALISVDADLSIELNFIDRGLKLLGQHDLVVGSKKLGVENRSWLRRFGSDLYIWTARSLYRLGSHDFSLAAKAYRVSFFRPFAKQLAADTNYVVDCVYLCKWHEGRATEIPVACDDRRPSRFNLRREAWDKYSHLATLWRLYPRANHAAAPAPQPVVRLNRAGSRT
jgi:glycosyltransferase involved in cell wall biosynthesis